MKDEIEKLKAACADAAHARDVARKDYNAARNALIGTPAYYDDKETADVWNTYMAADSAYVVAWEVYISEEEKAEKEINKMETENKMRELKIDAWDTEVDYRAALSARDANWDAYVASDIVLTAARDAAQKAADIANPYEAEED